jgi:hypothetical protein
MSRDEEAKNDRLFDSRTVERNIRKGLITRKDYEKHLKGLTDVSDKIAPPEALRGPTASSPAAADAFDHLDAALDEAEEARVSPAADGQRAAGAEGDEDVAEGDDDDIIDDEDDDDEDDVESEPPRN